MLNQFSRTELLIGKEGMEKLKNSRVAVFGIGGVGGYTVEALVRSGVGTWISLMMISMPHQYQSPDLRNKKDRRKI